MASLEDVPVYGDKGARTCKHGSPGGERPNAADYHAHPESDPKAASASVYRFMSATANPPYLLCTVIRLGGTRSKKTCAIDQPPTGDQCHQRFEDSPANRKPKCAKAEDREQNPERFCLSTHASITPL